MDIILVLYMVLFLYAALMKLFDYQVFQVQISRSPLIMNYAATLAWFVPSIEIIAAILLFIPRTRLVGLFFAFSIMFAFSAYIGYMLIFSPSLPCSCGGILSHMGWTEHLIFNICFTLLAALGIGLQTKTTKSAPHVSLS
ncbi:MauE/DoxX family redox-associated membrane protein [Dawidia soli]|uniref:MauE/DoxX family redox-associated membrane protein n=1 Tax=Dawidia soli TaxID=2782352 RepID=UPI003742CE21